MNDAVAKNAMTPATALSAPPAPPALTSAPIPPPNFQGSVVHLLLGTEGGGIITTTRQWVPRLTAAGWDIRFVSLSESKACEMLRAVGIEPRVVRLARLSRFTRLAPVLRSLQPAVIHVHNPSSHLVALVAARRLGTRVVRTVHADMFHEMRGALPRWKIWVWTHAMRWAFRRTDLITVVSPHLASLLPGVRDPRMARFLPNSYDPTGIDRDVNPLPAEIQRWLGDSPMVLAMGRLVPVKNYAMLLRAWGRVVRKHAQARLVLAGAGPLESALRAQIETNRLAETIRLVPWVAAVAPFLKRAAMIAISSRSESFPMLAFEAMAAAKPVVSTRLDGLQVEDGRTALLAPEDDDDAFADLICRLLEDPAFAQRLGQEGRAALDARFNPHVAAHRIATAYCALMSDALSRPRNGIGRD